LPPPCHIPGKVRPRRLVEPVSEPQEVSDEIGKICQLRLILVETEEHMRIWNELMIQDHPQGAGPLVGRQLRYLVESEHGWLGGLGFSSAALHLEDRDRWIGWDWDTRRANLHHVVNMSRFLIRSSVSCQNLASRLLGMAIREFPRDFETRYGYRPLLLETFVDANHFKGICYRAANWQLIGHTKGRGRQDHFKKKAESIKDIYVYPLEKDFRIKIGLSENSGLGTLDLSVSIDRENRAEKEFGGAMKGRVDMACNGLEEFGMKYATEALSQFLNTSVPARHRTRLGETGGKENWAPHRLLDAVIGVELRRREEERIKKWLRTSCLPLGQTLGNFEWIFQPSIQKSRIESLATCAWVREQQTILFQGPPGTGKTHLSAALGVKAIENGFTVVFYQLQDLLPLLKKDADLAPQRLRAKKYMNAALLIVDEVGFQPMTREEASLFFRLVNSCQMPGAA